jgi:4-hydroxy-2-oxoheptanedioate aldolase
MVYAMRSTRACGEENNLVERQSEMHANRLKEIIRKGGSVFGTIVSLPEPGIVEMIGYAGFDFVVIDMEHSPTDIGALRGMLVAADGAGITPLVRVGTCEANPILRVLDSGAMGVMVPHVRNKQDAVALVRACRYPPLGMRGVNAAARAARYGESNFIEHAKQSDQEILTIALIEDVEGVDDIKQIADVPGLDVINPGPGDLSASFGLLGQGQHPTVQAAVERVAREVLEHPDVVLGYYIADPSQIKRCEELGARFVLFSQDSRVLFSAYRDVLVKLKPK